MFVMEPRTDGSLSWKVTKPRIGDARVSNNDVAELDALTPPPRSKRDVMDRLEWGSNRAQAALKAWRETRDQGDDAD
jgi:hypothetical protein